MRDDDFGPVPVSQLKAEAKRVFAALGDGRRVLISRHGQVVAVIEPATVDRHARALALFAVAGSTELPEMSASVLGQGSPSEYVRNAESGVASYVTRDSKVYGLLRPVGETLEGGPAGLDRSLDLITEREQALAAFEREHPEATADQFASAVAEWRPVAADSGAEVPAVTSDESVSEGDLETLVEALYVKGHAQESAGDTQEAVETLTNLVDKFREDPHARVRAQVNRSMVALGRLYAESDPGKALEIVESAIERISHGEAVAAPPPNAQVVSREKVKG